MLSGKRSFRIVKHHQDPLTGRIIILKQARHLPASSLLFFRSYFFIVSFQLLVVTMGRFLRKLKKKIQDKIADQSSARDVFEEKKRK
jgi:hypothetical protein